MENVKNQYKEGQDQISIQYRCSDAGRTLDFVAGVGMGFVEGKTIARKFSSDEGRDKNDHNNRK